MKMQRKENNAILFIHRAYKGDRPLHVQLYLTDNAGSARTLSVRTFYVPEDDRKSRIIDDVIGAMFDLNFQGYDLWGAVSFGDSILRLVFERRGEAGTEANWGERLIACVKELMERRVSWSAEFDVVHQDWSILSHV